MFTNDPVKDLLKDNIELIDVETPNFNHRKKFIDKLSKQNEVKKTSKIKWWYSGAAAILLLSLGLMFFMDNTSIEPKLTETATNLPEEVINATFHFEGLVKRELEKIELERNQDTNEIIDEAFKQLKVLETEQQNLQERLKSHYDKRLVKALISNFQYRIQLLENVMQQIELTKEINTQQNEVI